MNDAESQTDIVMLRTKFALNHFKRLLLGNDLHIPRRAQKTAIFRKLAKHTVESEFNDRTWCTWFSAPQIIPKVENIKELDRLASKFPVISKHGLDDKKLPPKYFDNMVHGGLVRKMLKASKAKHPLIALISNAEEYQPVSALHLHLDAIEICALSVGHGKISLDKVKQVGAERILTLLAERWGPRHGTIFSELSSDLRLAWNAATPAKQSDIRNGYARLTPNVFEKHLKDRAIPDWRIAGIESDISPLHIYKALFSLAADTKFLVADRLETWALDLATAALAMYTLAWTEYEATLGKGLGNESSFWIAFRNLFFNTESINLKNYDIKEAMDRCRSDWNMESFDIYKNARSTYLTELTAVGTSAEEVYNIAMSENPGYRFPQN